MLGFNQFQDDLNVIQHALYTGQKSAAKEAAQQALVRVRRFAATLENLDLHEVKERPGAPSRPYCRLELDLTRDCAMCGGPIQEHARNGRINGYRGCYCRGRIERPDHARNEASGETTKNT